MIRVLIVLIILNGYSIKAFCQFENLYMGFGVGPETVISGILPKLSFVDFNNNTYYGAEASVWMLGTLWFSADGLIGQKIGFLTIDNSIGYWRVPKHKPDGVVEYVNPSWHLTINPKIGMKFGKIWLKTGPSFIILKDYDIDFNKELIDITKWNSLRFNVEILINLQY